MASSARGERGRGDSSDHVDSGAVKERVYATFTGLAIVLVQHANVEHTSAVRATATLLIGVLAISLAGFSADVIAHLAAHAAFPDSAEFGRMLRLTGTAVASASLPLLFLVLAVIEWLTLSTALTLAAASYVLILCLIGLFAVRRTRAAWWRQAIALGILVALGLIVIVIQQLAHAH